MDTNPIYDSSNQPITATVGTNTESSLSGLPMGKSGGGEVYLKTSPATLNQADGADATIGATTNAPVADNTTVASATAATGIALWKRLVNLGIAILAKLPAGAARTITCSTVSGDGTVSSGKKWIQFIFSSDFSGTLAGVAFTGATDTAQEYPVLPAGDTYAALTYTISAGSVRLTTLA